MKFPILLVAYTAMTLAKDVYSGSCYYDVSALVLVQFSLLIVPALVSDHSEYPISSRPQTI